MKFLTLCSLISVSVAFPFNESECNTCVNTINSQREFNNNTISMFFNTLGNLCDMYNISHCTNMLNKSEDLLLRTNSTTICRKLGYCDELNFNNYITTIETGNETTYVFTYYNRLLGLTNNSSDVGNIQFHTNWSIILDEPLVSLNTMKFNFNDTCYSLVENDTILKIETENYLMYYNLTNMKMIDSFYTGYHLNVSGVELFNTSEFTNDLMIDVFNNGTVYSVFAKWNMHDMYCYTDNQFETCCNMNSITEMYLLPWNISYN